jgi:ABC-2 type transport system ATP-binding protein
VDHADNAHDRGAHRRPDAAAPAAGAVAVDCDAMVVRYGDTLAVDRLSFTARHGEVLALLGPNGAGKTSTVEALEGYRPVASGTVRVLGLDPGSDHAALVPRIGVMLQNGGVYPMLGPAQVLHLFAAYYDDPQDPDALLDLVGLGRVRRTPWRRLSGGEQQRLSLALALVGRPDVLFLDEPTAGVDPEGRIVVRDIISAQRDRGLCVLLTTHELAEAERVADRVVIIDHGRLLAEGTPAGLAAGTADGSVRFSTDPGIDTAALADAVAPGATVVEEGAGAYRLHLPAGTGTPAVVAALAGWLAERDLALGDLRTGRSLEEAYLAITGAREAPEPGPGADAPRGRRGRARGRH